MGRGLGGMHSSGEKEEREGRKGGICVLPTWFGEQCVSISCIKKGV